MSSKKFKNPGKKFTLPKTIARETTRRPAGVSDAQPITISEMRVGVSQFIIDTAAQAEEESAGVNELAKYIHGIDLDDAQQLLDMSIMALSTLPDETFDAEHVDQRSADTDIYQAVQCALGSAAAEFKSAVKASGNKELNIVSHIEDLTVECVGGQLFTAVNYRVNKNTSYYPVVCEENLDPVFNDDIGRLNAMVCNVPPLRSSISKVSRLKASNLAHYFHDEYAEPAKIDEKSLSILRYFSKRKYFDVLTNLLANRPPARVLVVGCGKTMAVDYMRLARSGLQGSLGENPTVVSFVDPHYDEAFDHKDPPGFKLQGIRNTFEEFARDYPGDKYDLVCFPMSFHAVFDSNNFFAALRKVAGPQTAIVGMFPNPDIYKNPLYAAACGYEVLSQREGIYAVRNIYTGVVYYDTVLDVEELASKCYANGFLFQCGGTHNMDLFKSKSVPTSESVFTFTMASMRIKRKELVDLPALLGGKRLTRGVAGVYNKLVPSHAMPMDKSSLLRCLGSQCYVSSKLDGVEGILAVSCSGFAVETANQFSYKHKNFDKDQIQFAVQVEVMDFPKLNKLVVVDLIYDNNCTIPGVDLGDCSFAWRYSYIKDFAKRFSLRHQAYHLNEFELVCKEGLVITPAHSSRLIYSNGKPLGPSASHIKKDATSSVTVKVNLKSSEGDVVTVAMDVNVRNEVMCFSRVRPGKEPSGKYDLMCWEDFIHFVKYKDLYDENCKAAPWDLGVDLAHNMFVAKVRKMLSGISWLDGYKCHFAEDLDHTFGSDDCDRCTGKWKGDEPHDFTTTIGYRAEKK